MKVQIVEAEVEFFQQPFLKPLQLSSGSIYEITEARVKVTVHVDGRQATGRGSIYLSDLWGWPDAELSHSIRDKAMRDFCGDVADNLYDYCGGEAMHPLELGLRLHETVAIKNDDSQIYPPLLARLICASPFDAALHDATGLALERSSLDFYHDQVNIPSADKFFASCSAIDSIARTLRSPQQELMGWYLIGVNDTPEDLEKWICERGYHCFKIKIGGVETAVDVARTRDLFAQVNRLGAKNVMLSVDSNCANPDANSVLEYLQRLESEDPEAYEALQFVEQPTGRDINSHAFDWHEVTKRKPVLLDEGLVSFDVLNTAKEQGWGGLALKTCKGHSFALIAAAWGYENNLLLSMQDLTNPGYAAIHAALLAAHLPITLGIELNSAQYTPAANAEWRPRLDGLFNLSDGKHRLPNWKTYGLGSNF
jgi:L-alanine-DL-glutamate epimerase-like enolase superfamily enzyme